MPAASCGRDAGHVLHDALELLGGRGGRAGRPEGGGAGEDGEGPAGAHPGQSRPARRAGPPGAVTPRYPGAVERPADEARRRRIAIALVVLAVVLFIVELVAIALGLLEVAALVFVIFVGGWFALRSYQRRTGGA